MLYFIAMKYAEARMKLFHVRKSAISLLNSDKQMFLKISVYIFETLSRDVMDYPLFIDLHNGTI